MDSSVQFNNRLPDVTKSTLLVEVCEMPLSALAAPPPLPNH
jgi:hypothetical protein